MAANSILDRAYGRPPQALDVAVSRKTLEEMTDAELLAIVSQAEDEALQTVQ